MRIVGALLTGLLLTANANADMKKYTQMDPADAFFYASEAAEISETLVSEIIGRANQKLNMSEMGEKQRELAAKRILGVVQSKVDEGSFQARVKDIYLKFLTKEEMTQVIAFYESDIGKKLKTVQRPMNHEVYEQTIEWMGELSDEISKLY